ncbi:MAG TPA: alpha/beta hydrolase [Glaciibacter sp.]|nr:alpha/beta hydrolase [Glaciibacter sp.]
MTLTAQSADGTTIVYERTGTGPALIVIGGAFNTRHSAGDLVPLLAVHFSVYAYDRRGRGDSTDTHPFATEREVEDLAALIDAVGGTAMVYGHSSGGAVGLYGAANGLAITKLAIYEPPFTPPIGFESVRAWTDAIQAAVDAGDRERAAVLFLQGSGAHPGMIEGITAAAWWPGMTAVAHTLPYDLSFLNDGAVPFELLRRVNAPTLVMFGDDSPPWAENVATTAADALPNGTTVSFAGQDHNVDPAVIAPQLVDFFTDEGGR